MFDEEEQWHVHRELARLDEEVLKGRYFSFHSDYKILEAGFVCQALRDIAEARSSTGDLRGAASACLKFLALFDSSLE